jgi:phosphoglycolate phosphatase
MSPPPERCAAVIFDLDGTLLDTLTDIANAANRVLEGGGFTTHSIDAYRFFVGEGVVRLFTKALPEDHRDEQTIADCADAFRRIYGEAWNVKTCPYENIPELLAEITARSIQMAVLSNKPDLFTTQCVRYYLGQFSFKMVLGQRAGVPRKPDPTAALQIAEGLSLRPEQVMVVGDTGVDMQTARHAGMQAIGALWGFRPASELREAGADRLIEHPLELLDVLPPT